MASRRGSNGLQEKQPVRVNLKAKTNVSKIQMTGFGREDGGCLGAPSPKVRMSMREKMGTSHEFLI